MKANQTPLFEPKCLATTVGSLPHTDVALGTRLVFEHTPQIPAWPQFPKRAHHEKMMVQFTEGMPALVEEDTELFFDTASSDFVDQLTDFYTRYLAVIDEDRLEALEGFAISSEYAAGFEAFLSHLGDREERPVLIKGQVTGPFTLGINLLDQDRRCSYYDERLRDVIVKSVTMKALWQISRLRTFGIPVLISLDEPSLLGFGSQMFITVSRDDIIEDINAVVAPIHAQGSLAGVHCEADTDWSLLMETDLDLLNFDAYDHMQAITLYPDELDTFFERGGCLGWGIVPTLDREAAASETVPSLLARMKQGIVQLENKGFERELILRRALITPSCGAGGVLTEALAERVLELLHQVSHTLRAEHGFCE